MHVLVPIAARRHLAHVGRDLIEARQQHTPQRLIHRHRIGLRPRLLARFRIQQPHLRRLALRRHRLATRQHVAALGLAAGVQPQSVAQHPLLRGCDHRQGRAAHQLDFQLTHRLSPIAREDRALVECEFHHTQAGAQLAAAAADVGAELQCQWRPASFGKQGQQALSNLQTGLRSQYGDNEEGNQLLLQLQQMLKAEAGLEPGNLKQLLEALQHFSAEASEQLVKTDDQPQVTNIDPARLPPAYRGRIQK